MVNAFSFCIYGPVRPKYHEGLKENIRLAAAHFPDWRVIVYVGSDTPPAYIQSLRVYPTVVVHLTGITGHRNSLTRFFALEDPDVGLMMVRDADSRIHWKDQWAIERFVASDRGAHIIRDHPDHGAAIPAGLWGLRAGVLARSVRELVADWTPLHGGFGDPMNPTGFGVDQAFLKLVVYPLIIDQALVHYSCACVFPGEHTEAFPFEWSPELYCGQIVDVRPPRRPLDFLWKK